MWPRAYDQFMIDAHRLQERDALRKIIEDNSTELDKSLDWKTYKDPKDGSEWMSGFAKVHCQVCPEVPYDSPGTLGRTDQRRIHGRPSRSG